MIDSVSLHFSVALQEYKTLQSATARENNSMHYNASYHISSISVFSGSKPLDMNIKDFLYLKRVSLRQLNCFTIVNCHLNCGMLLSLLLTDVKMKSTKVTE